MTWLNQIKILKEYYLNSKRVRNLWNLLIELSFQTSLVAQELVKGGREVVFEPGELIDDEVIPSQGEIELEEKVLFRVAANIQYIMEGVKLNLRLHPFSDMSMHRYLSTLIEDDEEGKEITRPQITTFLPRQWRREILLDCSIRHLLWLMSCSLSTPLASPGGSSRGCGGIFPSSIRNFTLKNLFCQLPSPFFQIFFFILLKFILLFMKLKRKIVLVNRLLKKLKLFKIIS